MRVFKVFMIGTITVCCFLGMGRVARAAEKAEQGPPGFDLKVGSEPIHISARSLVWDHKANTADFQKEVVAQQKDLTIYADDLMILFDEAGSEVNQLVAKGNVKIIQLDRRATCDEAVYDRSQNRIVLQGNPVMRQGENEVRGARVTFYVNENRSVVEGGEKEPVRVRIIPEKGKTGIGVQSQKGQ